MSQLRQKTFLEKISAGEMLFELALALVAGSALFFNAYRFYTSVPPDWAMASGSGAVGIIAVLILSARAITRNRKARAEDNLHALDGVLLTLYAILQERTKAAAKESFRMCVFCPSNKDEFVHQLTNYVGDGNPSGAGRDLPLRAGVVGTAFRTGEAQYDRLPKNTNVADYLAQNHGFSREEAGRMRQDRRAWAAVPVGGAKAVVAVIFVDSKDPEFFGNSGSLKRKIIESATIGVARFVEET